MWIILSRRGRPPPPAVWITPPAARGSTSPIALARTGIATYHAGCVGKDGQPLLDLLRANQVRTEHLLPVEQVNGHAIIQVGRTGQNSIIIHGGSNGSITREQVDATLAQFTSDAVVLLQNEISQVDYIARRCRDLGIPLVFNPSPISPQLLSSFPFETVTLLLINETEGQAISGRRRRRRYWTPFWPGIPGCGSY